MCIPLSTLRLWRGGRWNARGDRGFRETSMYDYGSDTARLLGPKSTWPKRYQQINGFARMRNESRMRIIMFLFCLQRGACQAIPRAWKTNGRTGGSRTPRSRSASIGDQYIEAFTDRKS